MVWMKAIEQLESQGCFSEDWTLVDISENTDLRRIRNVYFRGRVSIGSGAEIINVPGGLLDVRIGDNVRIVNVDRIERTPDATFGIGTEVAVLDETGGRPVKIYPGISSQVATLAAMRPDYAQNVLFPLIDRHISGFSDMMDIGNGAEIIDCGPIINVRIWPYVKIDGASRLKNGCIVNNVEGAKGLTYVGQDVNAENFIIEDAVVANGVLLRDSYVGQGCVIDKGFTAHDSLFFANCSMENGEACAVLAGPYSVSMHKSTLLIGVHTSFMNAGSGTNMSNHMYKLGPLHWGVLERGVKTSSNSYLMHGSRFGSFSLVMGEHKTHPDTSDFPFSYVFGDSKGYTSIVPGAMLKSYGLKRDAEKWPNRDRREISGLKKNDRINFHTFNPHTMSMAKNAMAIIDRLLASSENDSSQIPYKGMIISRRSLERGRKLYEMALCKYHDLHSGGKSSSSGNGQPSDKWIDLGGQILDEEDLQTVMDAGSIIEIENILDNLALRIDDSENRWIAENVSKTIGSTDSAKVKARDFDSIVEKDRLASLRHVSNESELFGHL